MNVIQLVISLLSAFFSKNPLVDEIIPIILQVGTALANAKAGQAFTVSFPESIDGHAGTTTVGWTPT